MSVQPLDPAALRAVSAARQVSEYDVVHKYLDGMERRGEIIPGAAAQIAPWVMDHQGMLPDAARSLGKIGPFLEKEGAALRNPAFQPDPNEHVVVSALRRFRTPADDARKLFARHGADVLQHYGDPAAAARQILIREARADLLKFPRPDPRDKPANVADVARTVEQRSDRYTRM